MNTNPAATTILVADDHPVVRAGLRMALDAAPDMRVVLEVGDGSAAFGAIERLKPDVAVLDIEMPEMSGIEVLRQIRTCGLPTLGIVLTMHDDAAMFEQAMDCGAVGYLLKDSVITDIVSCIRRVVGGDCYISPAYRGISPVSNSALRRVREALSMLTPTELRILRLIGADAATRDIAARLGISPRTVETHRFNMCSKLGIRGAFALMRYALENREIIKDRHDMRE